MARRRHPRGRRPALVHDLPHGLHRRPRTAGPHPRRHRCAHPARPGEGEILPHEETTPKAKSDRLDLLRGTSANLSPIWGLSLTKGLTDLLATDAPPLAGWTDDDGVEHTVWRVDEPDEVEAIAAAVGSSPVVVADGHHRYETSLAYRDERRAEEGPGGPADATMVLVVELVDDELTVRPIHRLVRGLPAGTDLAAALEGRGFSPAGAATVADVADGAVLAAMTEAEAIAVVGPEGSATLAAPRSRHVRRRRRPRQRSVAQALAGLPAHEVVYQHGTDLVQAAVVSGDADAGILLRPATVAQIAANAHTGERMPAKTTFFHPKPKTGIVFRCMPRSGRTDTSGRGTNPRRGRGPRTERRHGARPAGSSGPPRWRRTATGVRPPPAARSPSSTPRAACAAAGRARTSC